MAMSTFVLLPTAISEFCKRRVLQATQSDKLTHADRDGLVAVAIPESLNEGERTAIDRLRYFVCRDRGCLTDELFVLA